MKTILGIDFGTTTTVIAQTTPKSKFGPELIEVDGLKRIETVIRLDPTGKNVERIGEEAWDEFLRYPERTFFDFKPYVGSGKSWPINGRTIAAFDLSVLFLRTVREKIESQHFCQTPLAGMEVISIIGYPAEWDDTRKNAVVEAAKQAGFTNVLGCEEPLGAVYYHHFKEDISIDHPQLMMVYDFGGGTTDVSIMRSGMDRSLELLGWGGMDLGGHHFDNLLAETFSEKISLETGGPLSSEDRAHIRVACQRLKERLSNNRNYSDAQSEHLIPLLKAKRTSYRLTLDFEEFERLGADIIDRFEAPIHSALKRAGVEKSEIDAVILAGGAGRLYYAREKLYELFPPPQKNIQTANPQEVIAMGLALYGREGLLQQENQEAVPHDDVEPASEPKQADAAGKGARRRIMSLFGWMAIALLFLVATIFLIWWTQPKQHQNCQYLEEIDSIEQKFNELNPDKSFPRINALSLELNELAENCPRCIEKIEPLQKTIKNKLERLTAYCTHKAAQLEERYDSAVSWWGWSIDKVALGKIRVEAILLTKQCPPVFFQRIQDIKRNCDKKLD